MEIQGFALRDGKANLEDYNFSREYLDEGAPLEEMKAG